jgi:hypothetical protein
MRGSLVVLAFAMASLCARLSHAQEVTSTSSADDKKCLERPRGNPADSGLANRADPTLQGNKDCAPPVVYHATVSGTIFFDVNQNGTLDDEEVGIASWTLQLTGPVNLTTTANGDGVYSFTGLTSGTYTLCVTPKPGWMQISPATGAMCPNGIGYILNIGSLTADTTLTRDFGYISVDSW